MTYKVRVVYRLGQHPVVNVIDPPLKARDGGRLPHVYSGDNLCLYHPDYDEWSGGRVIAETIVPWISEWLYFYEVWLVTEEWLGGGEHPPSGKNKRHESSHSGQ